MSSSYQEMLAQALADQARLIDALTELAKGESVSSTPSQSVAETVEETPSEAPSKNRLEENVVREPTVAPVMVEPKVAKSANAWTAGALQAKWLEEVGGRDNTAPGYVKGTERSQVTVKWIAKGLEQRGIPFELVSNATKVYIDPSLVETYGTNSDRKRHSKALDNGRRTGQVVGFGIFDNLPTMYVSAKRKPQQATVKVAGPDGTVEVQDKPVSVQAGFSDEQYASVIDYLVEHGHPLTGRRRKGRSGKRPNDRTMADVLAVIGG